MTEWDLENLIDYTVTLCNQSTLSEERRRQCIDWTRSVKNEETHIETKFQELSETIEFLKENQIDRIDSGFNYNQTDILKKLKKEILVR